MEKWSVVLQLPDKLPLAGIDKSFPVFTHFPQRG